MENENKDKNIVLTDEELKEGLVELQDCLNLKNAIVTKSRKIVLK